MGLHTSLKEIKRCGTINGRIDILTLRILNLRHLVHERNHIAQELHQTTNTHVLACTYAEHRIDRTGDQALADTLAHLVLSKILLLEEFLHQAIVVGSSSLNQGSMQFLSLVHFLSRNILDDGSTTLGFPAVFLHQQHINHCIEARTSSNRILYGNTLVAIDFLHVRHDGIEIAVLSIQLIDKEDNGFVQLLGVAEGILRTHLGAILAIHQNDGLVGHVERCDGTADEVVRSRAINNVQLLVVPLHMEDSRENRVSIFLLYGEIVADGILSLYRATTLNDTCFEKHTFGKSCLAATRTAKQCNVLDFVGLIYSHITIDFKC